MSIACNVSRSSWSCQWYNSDDWNLFTWFWRGDDRSFDFGQSHVIMLAATWKLKMMSFWKLLLWWNRTGWPTSWMGIMMTACEWSYMHLTLTRRAASTKRTAFFGELFWAHVGGVFFSHENPRVPPKTPGDDGVFIIIVPLIKFDKAIYFLWEVYPGASKPSRRWFQISATRTRADPGCRHEDMVSNSYFMFTANLGEDDSIWRAYVFKWGWLKPPGKFVGMLLAHPTEGWFRLREMSEILWNNVEHFFQSLVTWKESNLKITRLQQNINIPNWRNATIWCKGMQIEYNDFMIVGENTTNHKQ